MQEMKYDEDSFLDVKRFMPELATLQAGGKFLIALLEPSIDQPRPHRQVEEDGDLRPSRRLQPSG
jgi:hypothetical protein